MSRTYLCIDLKSFYASVECMERGLDPMNTNLVVADPDRSEKTICLAVSPAMKALGLPGRCRVFEIPKGIDYIMAKPRMQLYLECAGEIYAIYLKFIAKEDLYVYSIDEVFIDCTDYLEMYQMTARELGIRIMGEIYRETGIPSACGIGTNLYLAKIALDITAKHNEDHIGELDEESYRETLWQHQPLKDFWRIGEGIAGRLARYGITTMEQIAKTDEEFLYRLFGIDAELLIDHAWGRETTTIADIKAYRAKTNSLTSGQVLDRDYSFEEGKLVVKEMADQLCLELVDQGLVTESITLQIGYSNALHLPMGRGTIQTGTPTSSGKRILAAVSELYDRICDRNVPVRRFFVVFNRVAEEVCKQYDLFSAPEELEREKKMQQAMLSIKKKFGKNAILKGMDLEESATAIERNEQIGGHRA